MTSFDNLNSMMNSYSEQKFVPSMEKSVLDLWYHVGQKTTKDTQIANFLNTKGFNLLQVLSDYLRKELKVPLYSGMYDVGILDEETKTLFTDNPSLESKLTQLKSTLIRIRDLIKTSDMVRVSFSVYEGFNSLATADVKEYRKLDVLKVVKSSFEPKFDDVNI